MRFYIIYLDENLNKVQNKTLPGSAAFKLYDTYGFPLDLTADILRGKDIKLDNAGFEKEMEKSKALARANLKFSWETIARKLEKVYLKEMENFKHANN